MTQDGSELLHRLAVRIVSRWLSSRHLGVAAKGGSGPSGQTADITYNQGIAQRRIKVKADPYFGTDPRKVDDHGLIFYRANQDSFAFEAVADAVTKEPGWVFGSGAEDLYYYFVAIAQPLDEVRVLADEPDEIFFNELAVERDELVILPMAPVTSWFERNFERYPTRPVRTGRGSAWYRLVPRPELEAALPEVQSRGSIFRGP